ncbi:ABC transporter permease [Xanthovirga aplysinae]|uniref:ABC transporter permease n=1 Tax=Xanthovirga aplysinae TaxID=2529853 RepID=UPI0012BBC671|nr:ABC transporter permease [Xanthovirga aplysinae]MTI33246.1 ABC transporter permease [Xanthovirga aplysinae]
MLINYLKIAWKVLLRNKFFTFVSLFGISFTLMVLLVVVSLWDNSYGNYGVEKDFNRTLIVSLIDLENEEGNSRSRTHPSYYLINEYFRKMKTPEQIGISSISFPYSAFSGDRRLQLATIYTDHIFWEILHFNFLKGRPFLPKEVEFGERLAVINEKTALGFFGTTDCLGKTVKLASQNYTVVGVVQDGNFSRQYSTADIYLPYTTSSSAKSKRHMGGAVALLQMPSVDMVATGKEEFQQIVSTVPMPPEDLEWAEIFKSEALLNTEDFARDLFEDNENSSLYLYLVMGLLTLMFVSLPAVNLININISRIMERASEIGVRKAYGASTKVLIVQFVIENLVVTLLGGILGLVLALLCLYLLNQSSYMANINLTIHLSLFVKALVLIILFGLFSGVYPALRMAKLQIAHSLKAEAQ